MSVCVKCQTLAAIPLFGHTKLLHAPVGLVSAAHTMAVVFSTFPQGTNDVFRRSNLVMPLYQGEGTRRRRARTKN